MNEQPIMTEINSISDFKLEKTYSFKAKGDDDSIIFSNIFKIFKIVTPLHLFGNLLINGKEIKITQHLIDVHNFYEIESFQQTNEKTFPDSYENAFYNKLAECVRLKEILKIKNDKISELSLEVENISYNIKCIKEKFKISSTDNEKILIDKNDKLKNTINASDKARKLNNIAYDKVEKHRKKLAELLIERTYEVKHYCKLYNDSLEREIKLLSKYEPNKLDY